MSQILFNSPGKHANLGIGIGPLTFHNFNASKKVEIYTVARMGAMIMLKASGHEM
jgi:hypothetical protein